jgi:glucose-6-phosphate isomerase
MKMTTLSTTIIMDPFSIELDLEKGLMHGARNHLVRCASDMRGYYVDKAALEELIVERNDPVHYEVFEIPVPPAYGHLMYCISMLHPGKVGDEYFMTKGHYHRIVGTAEIYLCLRGEGYILMKTSEGQCKAEPMSRGKMVYVPPCWAHRSINTGQELLVSFCVYPAEAGHNYGDIAQEGFPRRIFERKCQCVIE